MIEAKRKLASIKRIDNIHDIPNKDRISVATIGGWEVIVKKEEFEVGDLCVFFEIDSFLPDVPAFQFLPDKTKKEYKGKTGYRLKTMKLSGVISQGLALPISTFHNLLHDSLRVLDTDITETLGVIKYDVQETQKGSNTSPISGPKKGSFPSFIPKTDQQRIQNLTHYFETRKEVMYEESLKLDGSSCTMYKIRGELNWWGKIKELLGFKVEAKPHFGVCSRNLEISRQDDKETTFDNNGVTSVYKQSDFWKAAIKYSIEDKLPLNYAIQGELIAPNIQGNHEKVQEVEYYVFDIYDIMEGRYLTPGERATFMVTHMEGVEHVPVLGYVSIFKECTDTKELLVRVEGESMNPGTISEGRVYKAMDGSHSFKCISNKYLLKCEV